MYRTRDTNAKVLFFEQITHKTVELNLENSAANIRSIFWLEMAFVYIPRYLRPVWIAGESDEKIRESIIFTNRHCI